MRHRTAEISEDPASETFEFSQECQDAKCLVIAWFAEIYRNSKSGPADDLRNHSVGIDFPEGGKSWVSSAKSRSSEGTLVSPASAGVFFFQCGAVQGVAIIPTDLMQACSPGRVVSDGLDTFHVPQQQTGDAHGRRLNGPLSPPRSLERPCRLALRGQRQPGQKINTTATKAVAPNPKTPKPT